MRYLIAAHGCYHDKEKVSLRGIKLEFYSAENECVKYSSAYINSFCRESINRKDKVYEPVLEVTRKYYEMSFTRIYGDNVPSFISCCTTGEKIYDFKDGDLNLSHVIDMIRIHSEKNNIKKWVTPLLSVLSCNTVCYNTSEVSTNTLLHRRSSFNEENRTRQNATLKPSRINSSQKRKSNMNNVKGISYAEKDKKRRHFLKQGDRVISKETGAITTVGDITKEELKKIRKDPDLYWLPDLKVDDQVMHQGKLWIIENIEKGHFAYCTLQNVKTGEKARVKSVFLIKVTMHDAKPKVAKRSRDRTNRYSP